MNGGHACRATEETKTAGFHVDVRGLCEALGAPSEPPPSSSRSEDPTLAYTDPYADTLAAHGSFASAHPDWCVDVGTKLLTLTTFELWEALERGHVLAWMRVWREGMECWTPIGEIAEFTWALAGTPPPPSEPAVRSDSGPDPLDGPLCPLPADDAPPSSSTRPVMPPRAWARPTAHWIALGSSVALLAVVSAIVVSNEPPRAHPVETRGVVEPVETAEHTGRPPPPPLEDRGERRATMHHGERGQRRQPRDGRQAYGR
jgi:hypothetical protein